MGSSSRDGDSNPYKTIPVKPATFQDLNQLRSELGLTWAAFVAELNNKLNRNGIDSAYEFYASEMNVEEMEE